MKKAQTKPISEIIWGLILLTVGAAITANAIEKDPSLLFVGVPILAIGKTILTLIRGFLGG
jgi:Kef-type K+ transport system membrane component KefB